MGTAAWATTAAANSSVSRMALAKAMAAPMPNPPALPVVAVGDDEGGACTIRSPMPTNAWSR